MSEPKPFASLSSGLLARKGAARPAMRPQGFSQSSSGLEDLGWNDMGHDQPGQPVPEGLSQAPVESVVEHPRAHHALGLTPVQSPVHDQQAELADRFGNAELDDEADFDEDYDETAEPYEPEAAFEGFKDLGVDEDGEDEDEAEFRVQFKKGRKPLDMDALALQSNVQPHVADEGPVEDDVLELETAHFAEPEVEDVPVAGEAPAPVEASRPVELPVVRMPRARAAAGSKAKAAFTLRLDPERHLKLRLACALRGRSAQQLVTDALDALLDGMPELREMAEKAQKRG